MLQQERVTCIRGRYGIGGGSDDGGGVRELMLKPPLSRPGIEGYRPTDLSTNGQRAKSDKHFMTMTNSESSCKAN